MYSNTWNEIINNGNLDFFNNTNFDENIVPKNGAVINLQMAHLWSLKDGKIIKFQQYADTKGIADAMSQ